MIKKTIYLLLFFPILFFSQSKADAILGKWMATDKSVKVEIYKVNNDYRAKILWFNDKLGSGKPMNSRHDTANPNPKLRSRKIIGMEILSDLEYNAKKNMWENGKIYDAYYGRTWDSAGWLLPDGKLKVRGFWKIQMIGKSLYFYRVNN